MISQMAAKAERHGTYVGVEVTASALESFYTKHDPEKAGDAAKTAKKFARKTNKLMTALRDKYDDVPELQPEGTEAEQKKTKRAAAESTKTGSSSSGGGGGGKSLSDYDLDALQAEVTRRIADSDSEDQDADDGTELFLDDQAAAKIGPSSGVEEVTIIGGGPAGLAAAIYAARAGLKPLIVAPAFGGQLLGKGVDVENYPGVVGSEATGRGIVDLMRKQAVAFDTRMLNDAVVKVARPSNEAEPFAITLNGTMLDGSKNTERTMLSRTVIVATVS
eukprot:COSAG02_NODE_6419_length_3585_cov_14.067986_3_plen_276_part_00